MEAMDSPSTQSTGTQELLQNMTLDETFRITVEARLGNDTHLCSWPALPLTFDDSFIHIVTTNLRASGLSANWASVPSRPYIYIEIFARKEQ